MGENEGKAHVLMLSFPGFGHIAPLIQQFVEASINNLLGVWHSKESKSPSLPRFLQHNPFNLGWLFGFLERFQNSTTKISSDFIHKSLHDTDERRKALEWMKNICPTIATIGPMVPSAYLDNRMEDNIDYGLNMSKLDSGTCLEWLNTREPNSVVYVASGSMVDMNLEEIKEMEMAL